MQILLRVQKGVHREASVPARAVDIQPKGVPAQPTAQVAQRRQKPLAIAVGKAEQSAAAQERRHPAEEIQARVMRTPRRHAKALPAFRPALAQARVQAEAGLVFEDNGLARSQCGDSFFRLSRNCRASSARACT